MNRIRGKNFLIAFLAGWAVILLTLAVLFFLAGCSAWGFQPVPTATPTPPATLTSSPTATRQPTATARPVVRTLTPTPAACVVANTGGDVLNMRKSPGMDAEIIGGLMPGQQVTVIAWGDDWLKIPQGYISSKYCEGSK